MEKVEGDKEDKEMQKKAGREDKKEVEERMDEEK
jgi:hypothetical protein